MRLGRFNADEFTSRNSLKQENALSLLFFYYGARIRSSEAYKNEVGLGEEDKISNLGLADDLNLV